MTEDEELNTELPPLLPVKFLEPPAPPAPTVIVIAEPATTG
jgi:hypothetical protein